jgi:4-hydroxybenzoate polyprenyltransferase
LNEAPPDGREATRPRGFRAQLAAYGRLIRIERPIGTLLLLWPTLWALWIAGEGHPRPEVFAVFVLGVFLMRSAGCAINDFADRRIDPHVQRTRDRPLASGQVSPVEALLLAAGFSLIALGLVSTMNRLTLVMALGGGFLAATYPFLKRYTSLPQVYLGVAFGWAVPMAFAAQTGELPRVAWLLFIAVILWAVVYDTMYAMVDRDDDRRIGVRSSAILFGDADRVIIAVLQVLVVLALLMAGRQVGLGGWFSGGVAVAAGLFAWQQFLIRDRHPAACFRAFLNNNWVGLAVFAGIVLDYTFAPYR